MNNEIIHYGISTGYLKNWGIKEALREVYQNYIDFGEFNENKTELTNNLIEVSVSSCYTPDNLEFLRIGTSQKTSIESVGKHGEGLKMAALIFLREELPFKIITNDMIFNPITNKGLIGDTLALSVKKTPYKSVGFNTVFTIDADLFEEFRGNIIQEEDRIYTHEDHGSIVSKKVGNIYVGGLYVCNVDNFSRAYDFRPSCIPLDRDRAMPREFDVNYHSSKIIQSYDKITTKDTTYSDTMYVNSVPDKMSKEYKPIIVANQVEYVAKINGQNVLLKNESIKLALNEKPIFKRFLRFFKRNKEKGKTASELFKDWFIKNSWQLDSDSAKELNNIIKMFK
jgi:hypothetical protein